MCGGLLLFKGQQSNSFELPPQGYGFRYDDHWYNGWVGVLFWYHYVHEFLGKGWWNGNFSIQHIVREKGDITSPKKELALCGNSSQNEPSPNKKESTAIT